MNLVELNEIGLTAKWSQCGNPKKSAASWCQKFRALHQQGRLAQWQGAWLRIKRLQVRSLRRSIFLLPVAFLPLKGARPVGGWSASPKLIEWWLTAVSIYDGCYGKLQGKNLISSLKRILWWLSKGREMSKISRGGLYRMAGGCRFR